MTKSTSRRFHLLLSVVLSFCFPSVLYAHAVGIETKQKEGRVFVAGFFDDDTPTAKAKVRIEDFNKKLLTEGRMDDTGKWSFPIPAPGRYRVTVDAGVGHRATITITVKGAVNSTNSIPSSPSSTTKDLTLPTEQDASSDVVSDAPSRDKFTQFPWWKLVAGLGVIFIVALVMLWILRATRTKPS